MPQISPITGTTNTRIIDIISADWLVDTWRKLMGIDIADELKGIDIIEQYQCCDSKLFFFTPKSCAGSQNLYAQLEKFDWYYMPERWEHDQALRDIFEGEKVLEVGCGRGDFVERINKKSGATALGLELNQSAVSHAQLLSRPVLSMSLETMASETPASFDVICYFQVLEHVASPLEFLQSSLDCLKPGGRIIITVPNMASYIRHIHPFLLNIPPHHMTQWLPETFRMLPNYLPVSVLKQKYEPLAEYHVNEFVNINFQRIPESMPVNLKLQRIKTSVCKLMKSSLFIRRRFIGHTQYVLLRKL